MSYYYDHESERRCAHSHRGLGEGQGPDLGQQRNQWSDIRRRKMGRRMFRNSVAHGALD